MLQQFSGTLASEAGTASVVAASGTAGEAASKFVLAAASLTGGATKVELRLFYVDELCLRLSRCLSSQLDGKLICFWVCLSSFCAELVNDLSRNHFRTGLRLGN